MTFWVRVSGFSMSVATLCFAFVMALPSLWFEPWIQFGWTIVFFVVGHFLTQATQIFAWSPPRNRTKMRFDFDEGGGACSVVGRCWGRWRDFCCCECRRHSGGSGGDDQEADDERRRAAAASVNPGPEEQSIHHGDVFVKTQESAAHQLELPQMIKNPLRCV